MTPGVKPDFPPKTMSFATVNPVVAPIMPTVARVPAEIAPPVNLPVKQRPGPPVNKAGGRIVPVSGALASARRDPRLARLVAPQPIAPNVFDMRPLERVTKRKNVITIDVRPDAPPVRHPRDPRRRDPRLNKRDDRQQGQPETHPSILERLIEIKSIDKLPPIPKIRREREPDEEQAVVPKKKKDTRPAADANKEAAEASMAEPKAAPVALKRSSAELLDGKPKKTKIDKFNVLFGNEDVDLRQLPQGGRRMSFRKSPSIERERRRTTRLITEDTDLRVENGKDFGAEDHKKSISIIMSQAKKHFTDGQLDKNQYNTLMYQVLQLKEKLQLKEAKQRESLEVSKRKVKAQIQEANHKTPSRKTSPNTLGDIDERITPPAFFDTPLDYQSYMATDSVMRVNSMPLLDTIDGPKHGLLPIPPAIPQNGPHPFPPAWRGPRQRTEEYVPRRFRAPGPPYFRGKFDKRGGVWPPFDPRPALPPLPTPKIGMCQGQCPLQPYERISNPPPLGVTDVIVPPTDFNVLEYIDQDPFRTIQIDGIAREIRFYGDTAIIMMDWDDPREIRFLPGRRRVTFDNKDSIVLSFNEGYKKVEIDDQVFDIKFGAPTRELYINGRWFECIFGGHQPLGVIIDGKPRLVHLEGPLPQVDISKTKRTDLVAGKINLIVNAVHICPVYLDAKVQKFQIDGKLFTLRFVDSFRTVLINEQPFEVEFDDLPRPIRVGDVKYFIRFSALPKYVKPGLSKVANMEGSSVLSPLEPVVSFENIHDQKPLFATSEKIPGLETRSEEKSPENILPILGNNINVNDLFAKLVATGIIQVPNESKKGEKALPTKTEELMKPKPKEDKNVIHRVDLLKPETLRVKQPGLVEKLYAGMQCSGCATRFPPEHTVRYSRHLDWHFRQNRRDKDSARRAHSRRWHYDLSDWLQYEEVEHPEEREKSWFETGGAISTGGDGAEVPSVAAGALAAHHCALCGDAFQQFYHEDEEEWHLRNAVRHEHNNYHPMCLDDYKLSLTKNVTPAEESLDDVDEDTDSQSDSESVVEVIEPMIEEPEPVEIDNEGDEDDVIYIAEPVEEVLVEDDADTDDETVATRAERDRLAQIDFSGIKPVITAEEWSPPPVVDTTQASVQSSLDGNTQLEVATVRAPPTAIRINISKTVPTLPERRQEVEKDEPPPPVEEPEPEPEYTMKPQLVGLHLSRQPPVQRGSELSGLCSIM
ncbi:unnamed protein product [Diatraea saccharalis]|uniref:PCFS4-like zinc finger domain-containing protein n=1 Tax=Diatraea saccharalis TaxID=40085 RepID=A0A9N9R4H0_9NEOP|nr:unnamed protein product [Diatraea saccharalis]